MSSLAVSGSQYSALIEGCGVLDRSDRGKLALTGSDAKRFLQGQVTNDIEGLQPGGGCYAAFLTPKGKMLGDLRVLDTGEELLLDTERSTLQALFNMIRRFSIGYNVQLHKRTLESGLVSLIGPSALTVAGLGAEPALPEFSHGTITLDGLRVRAVHTDVGLDLICAAESTAALIASLVSRGGEPVSEEVAECLRIEQGRPRYGVELDETVIPQEAGLNERAVSFTKGCYVGQETVARLFYRGKPNRHLRGLRCQSPVRAGDTVSLADRVVATVASAAGSPRFGPIALALVRREAPPGSAVSVGEDSVGAVVVELPFES